MKKARSSHGNGNPKGRGSKHLLVESLRGDVCDRCRGQVKGAKRSGRNPIFQILLVMYEEKFRFQQGGKIEIPPMLLVLLAKQKYIQL